MRDGWTETNLGTVTTHFRGTVKVEDGIPYPASGVMMEGRGLIDREPFIGGVSGYKKLTPIAPGQLVLRSITAWEAPITVVPVGYIGRHVSGVFPVLNLDESQLNPEFMRLICQWPVFWNEMRMRATGSVLRRKTLSANQLQQIPLKLPPLEEQRRIVDVVSSVDIYIDALKQQVNTARNARNAVLHGLLAAGGDSWTEQTLGDVAEVLDRLRKPISGAERKSRLGDVPYYGATGRTGWIDEALFNEELVLLGEDAVDFLNPDVHKAYLVNGPSWVNNHAHVLRPKGKKVMGFFLMESLNAVDYSQFVAFGTRSKLTQGSMMGIRMPIPPLDEQARIVEIVSSMDDVIQSTEQAVTDAKNLRSGLLSELLSGEHEIPTSYDKFVGAA
jgi:restriction endonuclease S subunit